MRSGAPQLNAFEANLSPTGRPAWAATARPAVTGLGVALALMLVAAPAFSAEVVVKNDSLIDFGQGFVVGDFVVGEHAGARLTSPCDGAIVAVQILWLSALGGATQTLENAIHIYADGVFPGHGVELQILEGPVMTPGYLNEFREIDENHTPLNVPVTAGQSFYVTLEYGEATHIAQGTASVVRDVNGCQANRNVLYAIPGGWMNFCFYLNGDLVIRAVIDCAEPTGACCRPSGICENGVEQGDCTGFGVVWTQGQSCGQVTCTARGACCVGTGCLQLATPAACQSAGGVYAGHGTNCTDGVCVRGACCMPDGSCLSEYGVSCASLGGDFQGFGSSCTPNNCLQPTGACCVGTACFAEQTQADCEGAGFQWMGPNSTCDPNPCAPSVCRGDCNCNHQVGFTDIDLFVAAIPNNQPNWTAKYQALYGTPPPTGCWANCDVNGNGNVGFDDIDPFVDLIPSACPN